MRKVLSILMLMLVSAALFGCAERGETQPNTQVPNPVPQVPNPVHQSTAEEIFETLGITFHIPDDAQNVRYSTIAAGDEKALAQVMFTRSNVEYTHRIQSKAAFEDISGAYFEWTTVKAIKVAHCSGELRYNKGREGICLWYDTVPGLMYSVYTGEGADEETLISLVNELFVPAKDAP